MKISKIKRREERKREGSRQAGREGGRERKGKAEKNRTKEKKTPLYLGLCVKRRTCGDHLHAVLPGAGLMRKLYTVSKHFNNLNYIWVCGTHHVQTYLKESRGNIHLTNRFTFCYPIH